MAVTTDRLVVAVFAGVVAVAREVVVVVTEPEKINIKIVHQFNILRSSSDKAYTFPN